MRMERSSICTSFTKADGRVAHRCRCLASVRSVNAQPEPGGAGPIDRNGQSRKLLNGARG